MTATTTPTIDITAQTARAQEVLTMMGHPEVDYRSTTSDMGWVLAEGALFTEAASAHPSLHGPLGRCYDNALEAALVDPALRYCEGYAFRERFGPIQHAWNLDAAGRVIDVTWHDYLGEAGYVGIALDTAWVARVLDREEHMYDDGQRPASILFCDWKRGFKFLRGGLPVESRPQRQLTWTR